MRAYEIQTLDETGAVRPDAHERACYFHGIAGGDLLLRFSQDPCPSPFKPRTYTTLMGHAYEPKIYFPVGLCKRDQPLIRSFRRLRHEIKDLVEDSPTWTWFTVIRIGYRKDYCTDLDSINALFPAVFLLNVHYGTTFEEALPVAKILHEFLWQNDIRLEIQVRENEWGYHAAINDKGAEAYADAGSAEVELGTSQLPETIESLATGSEHLQDGAGSSKEAVFEALMLAQRYLSNPGWEICPGEGDLEYTQSGGAFLTLAGQSGLFMSSCLHGLPLNQTSAKKDLTICQGGSSSLEELLRKVEYAISTCSPEYFCEEGQIKDFCGRLLIAIQAISAKEKSAGRNSRAVGSVYAAGNDAANDSKGKLRGLQDDVTVIKLNEQKFASAANRVWVGKPDERKLYNGLELRGGEVYNDVRMRIRNNDGFLDMSGKIFQIQEDSDDSLGIPQALYLHRPAGSAALLAGWPNSIEACFRGKNLREASWELIVVPVPKGNMTSTETTFFSKEGDSGSAIIDENGTYIGNVIGAGAAGYDSLYFGNFPKKAKGAENLKGLGDEEDHEGSQAGPSETQSTPDEADTEPEEYRLPLHPSPVPYLEGELTVDVTIVVAADRHLAAVERCTSAKASLYGCPAPGAFG